MNKGGLLATRRLLKPWGRRDLPAPFADAANEAVGEIWFDTPAPLDTILAKYLFTGERLSVQVHPTAQHSPVGAGKDECWLVRDAEPSARLALGFRAEVSPEEIRRAALDGSIEDLLDWFDVAENDFFYVPAGTVHSMGPGLTLVEIQQNTDITYRLYDYGRDRALHLDEALYSIRGGPHSPELRCRIDPEAEAVLATGPYFTLLHCAGKPGRDLAAMVSGAVQVLPLAGHCTIGDDVIGEGASGWANTLGEVEFSASQRCLLVATPQPAPAP